MTLINSDIGSNNNSDLGHLHYLNLTGDRGRIKRQRHATLAFLKIDMRHQDPNPNQKTEYLTWPPEVSPALPVGGAPDTTCRGERIYSWRAYYKTSASGDQNTLAVVTSHERRLHLVL